MNNYQVDAIGEDIGGRMHESNDEIADTASRSFLDSPTYVSGKTENKLGDASESLKGALRSKLI